MDKIVAKAHSVDLNISSTPTTPLSSSKPCRYGDQCSRPGCRFRHSFDNASVNTTSHNPYCSNNWLPHQIEFCLSGEDLEVKALKNEVSSSRKKHIYFSVYLRTLYQYSIYQEF